MLLSMNNIKVGYVIFGGEINMQFFKSVWSVLDDLANSDIKTICVVLFGSLFISCYILLIVMLTYFVFKQI